MSWNWGNDVSFEKDIDVDVDVSYDFDVKVDVEKETDIDVRIDAKADVEGNIAEMTFDVEAYGDDTYTQLDFAILTIDNELSSITGYAVSVAD